MPGSSKWLRTLLTLITARVRCTTMGWVVSLRDKVKVILVSGLPRISFTASVDDMPRVEVSLILVM